MPRTNTEDITAYAHCPNPRCDGHAQRQVPAQRLTVEHTYVEQGGDMPGIEKSQVYIQADVDCIVCGRVCEVTDQERISYAPLSGKDPLGLLTYKPPEIEMEPVRAGKPDPEYIARLERELEIAREAA